MQVGTGRTPCASYKTDHLTLLHDVANFDQDLGLMPDTGIDPPAMIDNGRIATNRQWSSEDYATGSRCGNGEASTTAEIQPGMEEPSVLDYLKSRLMPWVYPRVEMPPEELRSLVERCDRLKPQIEALDPSARKVYLRRLQLCRDLYLYVLGAKEKGKTGP